MWISLVVPVVVGDCGCVGFSLPLRTDRASARWPTSGDETAKYGAPDCEAIRRLFAAAYSGLAVARVAVGQRVVEAQFVGILNLVAVKAEGLAEHRGVGFWVGDGVPVVDGLGVDGTAACELDVVALGAEVSEEIFAARMQAHLVERDRLDLGWLSGCQD